MVTWLRYRPLRLGVYAAIVAAATLVVQFH